MSTTGDRLALYEAILALIEQKRDGDWRRSTGQRGGKRAVVDSQVKELESEIFENPGAIEPWLIRRRRGEA